MKYLRTPDAVKGRLLSLDCLAKMGSLIANLLPHNATENCKLISTASHALLQAKSPFLLTLSMTIMLSRTDHFLLPAPDSHFLLLGIFPTQGSNLALPHCRQTLYRLSHQGIIQ